MATGSIGLACYGYNKVTIAHTTSGTNAGIVTRTEEYQPRKALWDWIQLLGILAIPVVVGRFTIQQGRASDANRKQQHETDLKIAEDQQKENALQAFFDSMSELILEKNLLTALFLIGDTLKREKNKSPREEQSDAQTPASASSAG